MTVLTLARTEIISSFFNVKPFVFAALPSTYTLPSFWTDTFGVDEESKSEIIAITQVLQNSLVNYNQMDSYNDMSAQIQSFYFASGTQTLSIHTGFEAHPLMDRFDEGHSTGFCEKRLVYIDQIEYKPLLKSYPNIEQSQDIANYEKLSFSNGKIVLDNLSGDLDYILEEPIFGNDINIYYLNDTDPRADYSASDLVPIAGYYVEDYEIGQRECMISAQDKRKGGNIKVPTDVFTTTDYPNIADTYVGKVIPLAYGAIKASKAIPTNGKLTSGDVTFRQALMLTALGTVQVKINDVWTTKTPTATDLTTGSFTLASGDARNGTSLYECRVVDSVGIPVTHSSDIIKDLNERYLGIDYSESNYNTAEWTLAEAVLETAGLLVNKETEIFELIRKVQQGSNKWFRYEIDPTGHRTIRIDDWEREESFVIHNEDIADIDDLPVATNYELLAARVRVEYAMDYVENEPLVAIDDTNYAHVVDTYRQTPTMDVESLLTTALQAEARAAADAGKYMDIIYTVECTVCRGDVALLALRIYDVGTIELTQSFVDLDNERITGTRNWLGVWKVQILGIKPNTSNKQNKIKVALIEKKF